ncbi:MAG: peptidylprolyl isomerase [Coriobacteriales bacterium]|jgi:FKBP-type peptidyl-prolyl cis-trans isomerase 2|nr:peptidylprolyl isomerase [Coriobacteriales bacterium]
MVAKGKRVKAHYKGTLDDGTVFDSSYDRGEPIAFVVGVGQMIPGFDAAVLEMEVGDKRSIHIPADQAYGEYSDDYIEVVPIEYIPNHEQLPVGQYIYFPTENEGVMRVLVKKIEDGKVHFDHNHELAGKALNFDIEVVDVEDIPAPGVPASSK